jgi:hypothetical protein
VIGGAAGAGNISVCRAAGGFRDKRRVMQRCHKPLLEALSEAHERSSCGAGTGATSARGAALREHGSEPWTIAIARRPPSHSTARWHDVVLPGIDNPFD